MKRSIWLEPKVIVCYALSLLALAEMIDLTIVTIAVPQIMSSLNTNLDSIAMVATSYIIAAAIFTPLTGIAVKKIGTRKVVLIASSVFGITSVLCGLAETLPEMIVFRLLQGAGGAFLPSIAQGYIEKTFHGTRLEKPMLTVFACILVLGPILGNILGGALTAELNWRFIFFINVPVCVVGFILVLLFMERTQPKTVNFDYSSLFLMALGLGTLEFFIDQGNRYNWFDSMTMVIIFSISMVSILSFIVRGVLGSSVVNFKLFNAQHINFMFNTFGVFCISILITTGMAYFPTMLQQIYNYPVDTAAYITAPRGVAVLLSAPIVLLLSNSIGLRETMLIGIVSFAYGCIMLAHSGPIPNIDQLVLSTVLQGFGLMAIFIPLLQLCNVGVSQDEREDASGVFNFFRIFGVSIGNSLAATLLSHQLNVSHQDLAANISPYANGYGWWAQNLLGTTDEIKVVAANMLVTHQSALISYLDVFYWTGSILLWLCWIPFLLKKPNHEKQGLIGLMHTLIIK